MMGDINNTLATLPDSSMLHYSWYEAMHTRVDILLHGSDEKELDKLSLNIYKLIHKLDSLGDRFNKNSEIFKINKISHIAPIQISDYLFEMLSKCIEAHVKTNGLFDITINSSDHSPHSINTIELDSELKTVHLLSSKTILDLNGYIKGYTLDKIRNLVSATSVQNALINLGNSSILGLGNHPFGKGWKIENLDSSSVNIELHNNCLTTSGNIVADRKHIIHPYSHEYIHNKQDVCIITPTGSVGEVLSTSLLLATKEQRSEILSDFGLSSKCLISYFDE